MTTKRDRKAYYENWANKNRDKLKTNSARYREANLDKVRDLNRRYAKSRWAQRRDEQYGLSPGEYDEMLLKQEGLCRICRKPPNGKKSHGSLHVDHSHLTGRVRGLLCGPCNLAIGQFYDNPETLESAARYLREQST